MWSIWRLLESLMSRLLYNIHMHGRVSSIIIYLLSVFSTLSFYHENIDQDFLTFN